jgi:cytochrome oxidase Cu insertion factor (SCO1/SenC/PrrC family)
MNTSDSVYKIDNINSETLIVSFAGSAKQFGGIIMFEFSNFIKQNFNNVSSHYYKDMYTKSYHKGIQGVTNNIDETVAYLKNEIKNYKNVIFIGVSSGGYAAILFGSLLNVTSVLAFIPQTILRLEVINEKYRDISTFINATTKYYIYGDLRIKNVNDCHHISHGERIAHNTNVFLIKKEYVILKEMRNNGELYSILNKLVTQDTSNI